MSSSVQQKRSAPHDDNGSNEASHSRPAKRPRDINGLEDDFTTRSEIVTLVLAKLKEHSENFTPSCFTLCMEWLYSCGGFRLKLPTPFDAEISDILSHRDLVRQEFDLARLWVFGQSCQIPALQNAVMDAFQELKDKQIDVFGTWYHFAYENTPEGSLLRQFAVDRQIGWADPNFKRRYQDFPAPMVVDLLNRMEENSQSLDNNCQDYYMEDNQKHDSRSATLPGPMEIEDLPSPENDQAVLEEDEEERTSSRSALTMNDLRSPSPEYEFDGAQSVKSPSFSPATPEYYLRSPSPEYEFDVANQSIRSPSYAPESPKYYLRSPSPIHKGDWSPSSPEYSPATPEYALRSPLPEYEFEGAQLVRSPSFAPASPGYYFRSPSLVAK